MLPLSHRKNCPTFPRASNKNDSSLEDPELDVEDKARDCYASDEAATHNKGLLPLCLHGNSM